MSSNSKLSLEERLKLATQSGGKKKGKGKRNVSITPAATPEPEAVIENTDGVEELPQTTEIAEEVLEPVKSDGEPEDAITEHVEEVIETEKPEPVQEKVKEVTENNKPDEICPVVELTLSQEFILKFGLSPVYYKTINEQKVLDSFQDAILNKFNELQENNNTELQKLNKKEVKLSTQISTLQKDKVKADLKFDKISNELDVIKNKHTAALTELESMKPKFEEINKECSSLQSRLADSEKALAAKEQTVKNLEATLNDKTSSLNNYKLDNDSYANREAELIDEIVDLKSQHENELSILETKIEQYKSKLEDMSLKSSMNYDADEFFKNENVAKEIDTLNEKLREQNDTWLNKYQSMANENKELKKSVEESNSQNEQNVSKIQALSDKVDQLSSSSTKFEKDNITLTESLKKLQNETSMKTNQMNKLKNDLKSANELNRVHSKQLQDVIKNNLRQIETKRVMSIPSIKTPDIESLNEKEALKLQLRDEWNIDGSESNMKSQLSMDNISEDGSRASSLNFASRNSESNQLKNFNFKNRHNSNPASQQLLEVDEEDPLLQRQPSNAGETPNTPTKDTINMNLVARLNNKIRSLEYDLEFNKHSKDKAAAEKADQQRKLDDMQRKIDQLKTFEQVNKDLVKEKTTTHKKFEYLENEIKMKNRRIMELTEDLKDMKELMHHQIQEIMSAAGK